MEVLSKVFPEILRATTCLNKRLLPSCHQDQKHFRNNRGGKAI